MPDADRAAYAEAANSRARVTSADPPPPAEEIHIWMATADRITRYVTIPRRQATLPVLMSVLRGLAGEPDDDSPERPVDISQPGQTSNGGPQCSPSPRTHACRQPVASRQETPNLRPPTRGAKGVQSGVLATCGFRPQFR